MLGKFSLSQVKDLQAKIDKITSDFTPDTKFVILMVHNTDLVHVICNQIETLPACLFSVSTILFLSLTFSPNTSPFDEFSFSDFPNLLGLELNLSTNHPLTRLISSPDNNKLKYFKIAYPSSSTNTTVPDGIESCMDLESLVLGIPLPEYPTSLCYLPKLRELSIFGTKNNWKFIIPNTMVNLKNLQSFQLVSVTKPIDATPETPKLMLENINSIELTNITVEQRQLQLQTLHIEGFALGFDEIFPILNARKIHELSIRYCDVDEITEEFIIFEGIKKLNLDNNRITDIPNLIKRLSGIESFSIKNNQLHDFSIICSIHRIHFIDVSGNPIESIPEEIIKKKKIKVNLPSNLLTSQPQEVV